MSASQPLVFLWTKQAHKFVLPHFLSCFAGYLFADRCLKNKCLLRSRLFFSGIYHIIPYFLCRSTEKHPPHFHVTDVSKSQLIFIIYCNSLMLISPEFSRSVLPSSYCTMSAQVSSTSKASAFRFPDGANTVISFPTTRLLS